MRSNSSHRPKKPLKSRQIGRYPAKTETIRGVSTGKKIRAVVVQANFSQLLTRLYVVSAVAFALTACELKLPKIGKNSGNETTTTVSTDTTTEFVERDVEAPEVFQVDEPALWDGRPSLGGVWVAYPDIVDPERVIIRNDANGKFVIGALFRRERDNPGPAVQLSSDAASALGVLAGTPTILNITALRRKTVPTEEVVAQTAPEEDVTEETLGPIAAAAAAIEKAEAGEAAAEPETTSVAATTSSSVTTTSKPATSSRLKNPYVQIGIFSIQENAKNSAANLQKEGLAPSVKELTIKDKKFWRVIVGPAENKGELNATLKKVRAVGFADAYAVSG
jgi:rare lipoprotein A